MQVEIFSDVICPWCFIGKRRLDYVLDLDIGIDVELTWRPYQLYPQLPKEGIERGAFLRARYGEDADRTKTPSRIARDAEEVGIKFNYGAVERVPNTMNAHRLLGSYDGAAQHDLSEALFQAYFCDGRDVGDNAVLADIASENGADRQATLEYLESDADLRETEAMLVENPSFGVEAVPTYRLGGLYLLPGAQTPDVMMQFIKRAAMKLEANAS